AKSDDGIRELTLRFRGKFPSFARFAVDPVQVALAVPQRRLQLAIVCATLQRAAEDTAGGSPLSFSHRRRRSSVVGDDPVGQSDGLSYERTLEPGGANSQTARAQLLVTPPRRIEIAQFLSRYFGSHALRKRSDPHLV